ncbi:hypothetical protein BK138_13640 [Paenibacillus rhizosphaerae]|uniref:Uncharacterized protein n=1 Tax=Paenibacillus rhizosphaerae TaxID=297318 RepID=A0A1R1EV71_9BACL|nr:hypothetical protein [Paenibacillus rhizosphaerae]OMF55685.1 hypothetical protein BK138_13640 [Paenibacillus rhizosphaerae]
MDEQDRVRQYLRLFGECFDVLSKWVKRALIVLVVMLILIQGALHIKQVRPYLSPVYKLDGIPVKDRDVRDWKE